MSGRAGVPCSKYFFSIIRSSRNSVDSNDVVISKNISIAAASPDELTRGHEAEKILGATKINNDIMFIIKL